MVPRLLIEYEHMNVGARVPDAVLSLPEQAVRHVQVLRLQPGDALTLFDGRGGEWSAEVVSMGKRDVTARLLSHATVSRELPVSITLALGMPANDRMDALVEKATELGVAAIQPLVCARSVLRLDGERALKKVAHWQSVAAAACEQSGRTLVPVIHPVMAFKPWLEQMNTTPANKGVLSFAPTLPLYKWVTQGLEVTPKDMCFLSGPEGGLSPEEEELARKAGWSALGLGPRVLRADTAPLMALSIVAACYEGRASIV